MNALTTLPLDDAVALTRTGDIWLFRGRSGADRTIQTLTNAPVNHVGMAIVLEDLPPLMWHAELGRSLTDSWTGQKQRGAQLHDLRDAVVTWSSKYGQRAWLRQLTPLAGAAAEDAALRTVARMDGTPFPRTTEILGRFYGSKLRVRRRPTQQELENAYCAEVVASTYQAMGLLPPGPASRYDPGSFWSGDDLELLGGAFLGTEIEVEVPREAPDHRTR